MRLFRTPLTPSDIATLPPVVTHAVEVEADLHGQVGWEGAAPMLLAFELVADGGGDWSRIASVMEDETDSVGWLGALADRVAVLGGVTDSHGHRAYADGVVFIREVLLDGPDGIEQVRVATGVTDGRVFELIRLAQTAPLLAWEPTDLRPSSREHLPHLHTLARLVRRPAPAGGSTAQDR